MDNDKWLNENKGADSGQKGDGPFFAVVLSGKSVFFSILFLAFSTLVLLWEKTLLWDAGEKEGEVLFQTGYFIAWISLTLLGSFLCLVQIRLPGKVGRLCRWVVALLLPIGAFFAVDLINSTRILTFSMGKRVANYLCYLLVFALFYGIFRRLWAAALGGGLVSLLFGVANYFVVRFRGQPILPWDLSSLSTAAEVAGGYVFAPTRAILLSALSFACVMVLCVKLGWGEKEGTTRRFRLVQRAAGLGITLLLTILIFPVDILSSLGISVWAWNQKTSSEYTGIAAGFLANVQFLLVDKPEGYSAQRVEELGVKITGLPEPEPLGEPESLPIVITVMNESFTDLQRVGDLSFTPDSQPNLHALQESGKVIWGTAYSSVYGGNTCNSEYEFLTGNTTAFLPSGSKPYQQYVDVEQTALPSILKEGYGYNCTAIHPGNRGAWQRNLAYPFLGFSKFIDVSAFDVTRVREHGLTSDASCYDQLIYSYEHREKNTPQFYLTVTIQNHGGYEDKNYPATVQVEGLEGKYPETEQYLSLIKKSDEDLKDLLDYFERQKDPVVILFFGDHWPNLESGFLTQLLGTDSNRLELSDLMREYQVPFFIWANYPIEGQKIESISLNYLSGLLLRAAGLSGSPYTKYLETLRETLPVITAVGTMDKEGNLYENGAETPYDDLLNEYATLQYNNAFGEEEKQESLFRAESKEG